MVYRVHVFAVTNDARRCEDHRQDLTFKVLGNDKVHVFKHTSPLGWNKTGVEPTRTALLQKLIDLVGLDCQPHTADQPISLQSQPTVIRSHPFRKLVDQLVVLLSGDQAGLQLVGFLHCGTPVEVGVVLPYA